MDMLSYFLGRLAGGGTGGSGGSDGPVYTDLVYNDDGSITFIDDEGQEHIMECEYVDGRLEKVKIDEITLDAIYEENTDKLIKLGDINIEVGDYPSEIGEIETLIDNSGVLEDTEGSVSEKVEQLIEKANVKGIILSGFPDKGYPLPKVADMRSLPYRYSKHWNYEAIFMHAFYNYSTSGRNGYYTELHTVYLPDWITGFSPNMFCNCGNLINLYGNTSNVIVVSGSAFKGCAKLTEFPYMPNLVRIEANAFQNCTGLTEVKIYNTLTTFASNAFNGCTNIIDIYVPWAEGEVAKAPWGATNATIHYNYVEGEETNAES